MKKLLELVTIVVALLLIGAQESKSQSVVIHTWDCNGNTVGGVPVGYYTLLVSFSATLPYAGNWELISYKDGGTPVIHDTLSSSISMGTLEVEYAPQDTVLGFVNYNLNLQLRRGAQFVASNVVNVDAIANPVQDTSCNPIQEVGVGIWSDASGEDRVFSLYPNPAQDILHIADKAVNYSILSPSGSCVVNGFGNVVGVSHLQGGIYTVMVNNTLIGRFMKY